ncbi:MAG: carbonic anhydrase [Deltaproteobacteria bacterium]|nr:carbonic anhydrase [Deltaproteobacteria bacterium]
MIHKNVITDFCSEARMPTIDPTAYVHPLAAVIGGVILGRQVMVSPFASIRGDEGQPLFVGDDSNVQDGVVIHALETKKDGKPISSNTVEVNGITFAVHIGERVSLAHQAHIHGPARVGDDTFVGMKSLVLKACVGCNCVIEPGCIIMGVTIPDGRSVPAGTTLNDQAAADALPAITDSYPLKDLNRDVVQVNIALAAGYKKEKISCNGQ